MLEGRDLISLVVLIVTIQQLLARLTVHVVTPEFAFGEPTEFGWQVLPDNTGWGPFYLSVVKRTR